MSAPLGTAQASLWVLEIYPDPGRPTQISGGIRPAIGPVSEELAALLGREIFQGQTHGTRLHEDVIVRTYSNGGHSLTSHAPLVLNPEFNTICAITEDPDLVEMGLNDLWVDVMREPGAIIQYQIGDLVLEFPCQDRDDALNPLFDFIAATQGR